MRADRERVEPRSQPGGKLDLQITALREVDDLVGCELQTPHEGVCLEEPRVGRARVVDRLRRVEAVCGDLAPALALRDPAHLERTGAGDGQLERGQSPCGQ